MRKLARRRSRRVKDFAEGESGAVLVETLVVLPVMIVFMMGILEFGAFLWTKLQVENGLKDAARFMGRCVSDPSREAACSAAAQNLAVYGFIDASGKPARAANWSTGDIVVNKFSRPNGLSGVPAADVSGWLVATSFDYPGAIFLSGLGISSIKLAARHEERDIGL